MATIIRITAKAFAEAYHTSGPKDKGGKLGIEEIYMCAGGAFDLNVWDYI